LSSEPQPVYAEPSLETTADITGLPFDDVETGDMEKILTPMKTPKKGDRESRKTSRDAFVESRLRLYKKDSGAFFKTEILVDKIQNSSDFTGDEKNVILYDPKTSKQLLKNQIQTNLEKMYNRKYRPDKVDETPEGVPMMADIYSGGEEMPPLEAYEGGSVKRVKFRIPRKKRRRIVGGGYKPVMAINEERYQLPNEKLTLDLARLKRDNVLSIKYKKNNNCPPNLKVQKVSQNFSDIVQDIIREKYDKRFFKLLSPIEKKILEDFVQLAKIQIDVDGDLSKDFRENYDILYGEFMSGNDNKEIKAKLKQYILYGMKTGKLRKSEGMALLIQMS
jgi:hypothetical protein